MNPWTEQALRLLWLVARLRLQPDGEILSDFQTLMALSLEKEKGKIH